METKRKRVLTIQAIQERMPWIMAPFAAIDCLFTPDRWAGGSDRIATSITHAFTTDSTSAGARLKKSLQGLSDWRVRKLSSSPVLQRLDWSFRKFFWASLWTSAVVMRLWPKKVRIPREQKRIQLISAPQSYPDFQSPALVVPASIPCEESSLPSARMLQAAHLFQDVFPVISPPQPEAHPDRRERVRQGFSWLYRIVRDVPHWHDDLVKAETEGNLLGVLATGGPFAKLLERAKEGEPHPYFIDLRHMNVFPVREGLCRLGCKIHFDRVQTALRVASIEYQGKRVASGDADWDITERIALCSLSTHVTVWRHGMQYHVGGLAAIAPITHNLPASHPVRRLLAAHISETTYTNFHTHLTLRRSGFDVTGFSFSYETILAFYNDGAKSFNIAEMDVRASAARRGIDSSIDCPSLRQALRFLSIVESYVTDYIDHYYADDAVVAADRELRIWFDTIDLYLIKGIRSYVPELSKANLARLCATYIYSVTLEHEENTLWDYSAFLPTTVKDDGAGPSVGEVQCVINFQLVVSSATNRLLRDITHLALDSGGRDIMAKFQSDLRQLQAVMEKEPDRFWQVFPADLEASVSA